MRSRLRIVEKAKADIRATRMGSFLVYLVKHKGYLKRRNARIAKQLEQAALQPYDSCNVAPYRMSYSGDACFVIGNGPSLSIRDLESIKSGGFVCFAANRVSDLFEATSWRPDYVTAIEPGFLHVAEGPQSIVQYVSSLQNAGVGHVFLGDEFRNPMKGRFEEYVSILHCPLAPIFGTQLLPFSDDIERYVSDLGSVTHVNIQIACYMGFKTIYLLGVDDTYQKYLGLDGRFHVKDMGTSHAKGLRAVADDNSVSHVPSGPAEAYWMGGFADARKADLGYLMCKEWAMQHEVTIYNATRGGALEVFDRVDLNTVLQGEGM